MTIANKTKLKQATFAGGCFWCIQAAFEQLPGVTKVLSGYTGGKLPRPTYEEVSSLKTGHLEAIQVNYSGRKQFLQKIWQNSVDDKKSDQEELKKKLTSLQYQVTQKKGTESAFNNEYWNNKQPGIYVDIVSGEPLFSSLDKYDSGTGWPSFIKPLEPNNVVEKIDRSLLTTRVEVLSKKANSHLGHVFKDGSPPMGLRYCINSAALRFIPAKELAKEGYGKYSHLFE